jgi:diguanylate cyclase (GGDEF)-like protein/PAS domain S-box-containing protein
MNSFWKRWTGFLGKPRANISKSKPEEKRERPGEEDSFYPGTDPVRVSTPLESRGEETLRHRLAVEKAVARSAAMLVSEGEVDFNRLLGIWGKAARADRAHIVEFRDNGREVQKKFEWCADGIEPMAEPLQAIETEAFRWGRERLLGGENVVIRDLAEAPPEAHREVALAKQYGVKSFLWVPLLSRGQPLGFLEVHTTRSARYWSEEDVRLLRAVSEMLSVYIRRRRAEEALAKSEERYRTLVENQGEGVGILDAEARFAFANPAANEIFGFPPGGLAGKSLSGFTNEYNLTAIYARTKRLQAGQKSSHELDITRIDGDKRTLLITITPNLDAEGKFTGAFIIFRDITEQKQADEKIRYLSFHDALTGLYNRAFFEEELKRLDTERQLPLSLLVGDINSLKLANDAFGHRTGDKLLHQVARILVDSCRKEDIVARWGGDEFAIIFPRTSAKAVLDIHNRIKEACSQAEGYPIKPSLALGVATKTEPTQDIQDVFLEAERRMYKNKLLESECTRSFLASFMQKVLEETADETEEHILALRSLTREIGQALEQLESRLNKEQTDRGPE